MKVSVAKPKFLRETTNLYVAELPEMASETAVRELFEQYGEVNNCKLVMNQETGLSRGVAFVLFNHAHEAEAAIQGLNGSFFPGAKQHQLYVTSLSKLPSQCMWTQSYIRTRLYLLKRCAHFTVRILSYTIK